MIEAPYAKDLTQADSELTEREKSVVVDGFNKAQATSCLFGVVIEDTSMQPDFNIGDLVIVDADRAPKPGDYVLACLTEKQQTVLRKYSEAEACLFQLLAKNDLWATVNVTSADEVGVSGVVVEHRRYL